MTQGKEEAIAIARLFGEDRRRVVGWVYLWNTSELSILWAEEGPEAVAIGSALSFETLSEAKSAYAGAVSDLLEHMLVEGLGDPM